MGRFIIWSSAAFKQLNLVFGTYESLSQEKKNYRLPMPMLTNPDVKKLLESDVIQDSFSEPKLHLKKGRSKEDPYENQELMDKLNPKS